MLITDQNDKVIATQQMMPRSAAAGIKKNHLHTSPKFDATRLFDIVIAIIGLIILSPIFFLIAVFVKFSSRGPVIFSQQRVGKDDHDFILYKFRTMCVNAHTKRSLTVGKNDDRITGVGLFLRRFKLDELPQLFNVLKNDMSIVGPRPELRRYVDLYNNAQREILCIKPGITDYASILFRDENELLASKENPEQYYVEHIIPRKIRLSNKYKNEKNLKSYFIIIAKTALTTFV